MKFRNRIPFFKGGTMNLRNIPLLPRVLVGAVLFFLPLTLSAQPAFAQGPYGGYGSSAYPPAGSGYSAGSSGSGYAPSGSAYGAGSSASFVYIVQRGDTLFGIAQRFGVSAATLANVNHLFNPNVIFAGMRLIIPRANNIPPSQVYVVRFGDTLTGIAIRFNTSVFAIQLSNHIPNPNLIFAGQRLVIPGGSSSMPYGAQSSPYGTMPYSQPPSTSGPYAAPPMTMPGMTPAPAPQPTPSSTPSANGMMIVSLQNLAFIPNTITVPVGTTVMWMNDETSPIPHTVTSGTPNAPSGMFDSGPLNPGQSFQFTFTTPGTFAYFCRIHGAAMTGTVVVTP